MFSMFQFYYVEENLSSVICSKFTDLKDKQNWTHSFNNYTNPKQIQNALESKNKNENNCSEPFISVTHAGRLGNKICQFLSLYLFKIDFGIRAVVSSKMYKSLNGIFETVPLPHLPNSCFETSTKSIYKNNFENIYKIFKKYVNIDENILNVTNIAHYTFIDQYPCPMEHLMFYRQKFHSLIKFKNENIKAAKYILENALKARKLDKSGIILVGTHVRRSDFIRHTRKKHLRYPTDEYYTNAFNLFRLKCKNAIFIVVSDDIKWCEKKLSAPDVIIA
ncbi:Galactoside 2-alpha-L-fucosyltransferase 1, partial [Armadillidium nasatum]